MNILTTINKSKWGLGLGVMHSVIVSDEKVYSFEAKFPLGKRELKVFTKQEYFKRISKYISSTEIQEIDINKYLDFTGYMLCHEFIIFAYMSETGKNPFDSISYADLSQNMYSSLKKFYYYMIYLFTVPLIVWLVTYLLIKPNNIEQCLKNFNVQVTRYEN